MTLQQKQRDNGYGFDDDSDEEDEEDAQYGQRSNLTPEDRARILAIKEEKYDRNVKIFAMACIILCIVLIIVMIAVPSTAEWYTIAITIIAGSLAAWCGAYFAIKHFMKR